MSGANRCVASIGGLAAAVPPGRPIVEVVTEFTVAGEKRCWHAGSRV